MQYTDTSQSMKAGMVQKTDKIYALESLRGVASFIVMLHHFFIKLFNYSIFNFALTSELT